ncbi:MAG: hypothetical protein AAGM40_16200 [Cyanobacteria bacterium J06573_2]
MQSLHRISASDLQRFLETPEELLTESEEIQIAVASFIETPRSLLEVLINSDYSSVVEVVRLHVNFAVTLGDYQDVAKVLRNRDLGQNERLAVELMQFAPVAPSMTVITKILITIRLFIKLLQQNKQQFKTL